MTFDEWFDKEGYSDEHRLVFSLAWGAGVDSVGVAVGASEEIAALRKDAERYRFLRDDFSVMGANIDGQHSWAYRRNFSLRGPTLDAAIDAAIQAR